MEPQGRDEELVARVARRDSAALRALYSLYNVRVYRFVLRLVRNEALAEDVVAETFLKLWQKAGTYKGGSSVSTWLFTIARNEAISQLRRRRDSQLEDGKAEAMEDDRDNQETVAAKKDKGTLMRACIDKLSDAHREIIDLVYYQEMSVADASAVLDIPVNTVKTRMFHARKLLSEHFRRAGVDRGWP